MTAEFNDIFYTATLLECIARATGNSRAFVAEWIGTEGIRLIYSIADVCHCLSLAQVTDEMIEKYKIPGNPFDLGNARGLLRGATAVGKRYAFMVEQRREDPGQYPDELYAILTKEASASESY